MTREQFTLKIGAVCLIIGSAVVLVARLAHGDLPADTGEAALSFVAAHPCYPLVHLSDWLGMAIWASGLVASSDSHRPGQDRNWSSRPPHA